MLALATSVGLFSQVAQIVMFREMLAMCRGTEVFFGVVLAAGLSWAALGSLTAGCLGRWRARRDGARWPRRAWALALGLFAANGLLLVGQIVLARHRAASWGGSAELTVLEAAGRAVVATGPVAFFCGVEFVLALHAARADDFARLYQADAWGAVAGGLAFTFLLVGWLDPVTLGPALTAALGLAVLAAGGRRRALASVAVGLAAAAAVWAGGLDERLHARRWRALHPDYSLRALRESRYGQLAVLRHREEDQHSLYLDGGLVQSLAPPGTPAYHARNAALFAAAQHPAPRRVLLVGEALGALPDELLGMGVEHVDALELDPALFDLAREFGKRRRDPSRLALHFVDGRRFLRRLARGDGPRYDLIRLALPDPLSAFVNRYFTVECFRAARAALNEPGVLITSVTAAANYPGETVSRLSASILRTLREVFPEVLVAPGERHTFLAATRPGLVSLDTTVLGRRFAARGIVLPDVEPDFRDALALVYAARLDNLVVGSQVDRLRAVLADVEAPINTDARPITYQCALLVWNQIVSASTAARDPGLASGTNAWFRAALGFRFEHGLVLPALIVLGALGAVGWGRVRRRRAAGGTTYAVLAAAFATGLFGMAAEIVLLFGFQSAYGYAYAQVGAIVAVFMVGLAVGARAGIRWDRRRGALAVLIAVMILYCLLLPRGLAWLGTLGLDRMLYGCFFLLVFLAGFLDGATFPALVGTLRRQGSERPGAWVYAADLAGAGVGALATGALLVPMLGTASALGLVAVVLAAALAALAAPHLWRGAPRPR